MDSQDINLNKLRIANGNWLNLLKVKASACEGSEHQTTSLGAPHDMPRHLVVIGQDTLPQP